MPNPSLRLGSARIVKVPELDLNGFQATQLLPGLDPRDLSQYSTGTDPRLYDPASGRVFMSVHTWVVRHEGKVLLIDTGAGNDKERPTLKVLDHLHNPYLQRLADVGVQPQEVDYILLTHIHADHVGWNTRWNGEHWVPTFPNATVICSDLEWRYTAALTRSDAAGVAQVRAEAGLGEPTRVPVAGVFADSIAPLEGSGRIRRIKVDGSEVLPGVRFLPTAGHSIDHAAISLVSEGHEAIFGGDVVHHPFELNDLDLVSMFCEFPDAARRARRWLVDYIVERDAVYLSSHFPFTSCGKITPDGASFRWTFFEDGGEPVAATSKLDPA